MLQGQGADRLGLGRAVQQVAVESAGVDAVDMLGGGAHCAGQAEPRRDDATTTSIGAAVAGRTCWPTSRCSCAMARVPGPDPLAVIEPS